MYVSDSHVISALLHLDRAPGVADWVRGMSETEFFAIVITLGEIEGGIQLQIPRNREFAVSLQAWINRMTIFFDGRILDFGVEEAGIHAERCPGVSGRRAQDRGQGSGFARDAAGRRRLPRSRLGCESACNHVPSGGHDRRSRLTPFRSCVQLFFR